MVRYFVIIEGIVEIQSIFGPEELGLGALNGKNYKEID